MRSGQVDNLLPRFSKSQERKNLLPLSDVVRRNFFGNLTVSGFQFNPAQLRLQHVEVRIG